jgi:hypothetical protein
MYVRDVVNNKSQRHRKKKVKEKGKIKDTFISQKIFHSISMDISYTYYEFPKKTKQKRSNKTIMSLSTISINHITETILSIY